MTGHSQGIWDDFAPQESRDGWRSGYGWVIVVALLSVATVGGSILSLLAARLNRPAAPVRSYVAGVSATAFGATNFRGGCEIWIGFVDDEGTSKIRLTKLSVLMHDNVIVDAEDFVPADPQRNGVELLGCEHGSRYPSTPPSARRVHYRRGAWLPAHRWYAVVLDIRLRPGARLIAGSIDGVRLTYEFQGWIYTATTAGGRFCTSSSSSLRRACETIPEPLSQ